MLESIGRGGGIRTRDPLHPMQVRYQAAPRPDRFFIIEVIRDVSRPFSFLSALEHIKQPGQMVAAGCLVRGRRLAAS